MNNYQTMLLESKVSKYFKNILKEDYLKEGVFELVTIVPKMISLYNKVRIEALKRAPNKEKIYKHDKKMKELIAKFKKIKNDKGVKKEGFIYIQEGFLRGIKEIIIGFLREIGLIIMALVGYGVIIGGAAIASSLGVAVMAIGGIIVGSASILSFLNFWYTIYRMIAGFLGKLDEEEERETQKNEAKSLSAKIKKETLSLFSKIKHRDPGKLAKLKAKLKRR